jgi:hypothetical protein
MSHASGSAVTDCRCIYGAMQVLQCKGLIVFFAEPKMLQSMIKNLQIIALLKLNLNIWKVEDFIENLR